MGLSRNDALEHRFLCRNLASSVKTYFHVLSRLKTITEDKYQSNKEQFMVHTLITQCSLLLFT